MLNKDKFKSLVYEKAAIKNALIKKKRISALRNATILMVCSIVCGVFVYSNLDLMSPRSNSATYDVALCNESVIDNGQSYFYYSSKSESELVTIGGGNILCDDLKGESQIVRGFSYSEDLDALGAFGGSLKKNCQENGGLATNVSADEIVLLAKEKATIEYDTIDVYFDEAALIWKVVFSIKNTAGGCQSVYLDSEGFVKNIIYGE